MTSDNTGDKRDILIKKLTKKGGFRGRIDAMCVSCIYDPTHGGSWKKQVMNCTSNTCPLFAVRAQPKSTEAI